MGFILSTLPIIIQVVFIEGILSLDNAMVLGTLVSRLPENKPLPLPSFLNGKIMRRGRWIFGDQQKAALKVGLLGAYLGRGAMLFLATFVIRNPWLKLLGALYLLKMAGEHFIKQGRERDSRRKRHQAKVWRWRRRAGKGFWMTVLTVELSDLVFSLDNVVATVAISNKFWIVFSGVAIGIFLMRIAAGFFARLIRRMPALVTAAYLLIFNIGLELVLESLGHREIGDGIKFIVSLATVAAVFIWAKIERSLGPKTVANRRRGGN